MSATDILREDHKHIKRLDRIITKCYGELYAGRHVPFEDLARITKIIDEFLDSIHYSREEDSYFPCVASYDHLKTEIKSLMIEHEFSRRIAAKISRHLLEWRQGRDAREPVARFLRTYSVYLQDHMRKEEEFFDKAATVVLSREEEQEMFEQFKSVMSTASKIDEMTGQIDLLEDAAWFKG